MEIIIKKGQQRVDPKKPETNPEYGTAVRAGRERLESGEVMRECGSNKAMFNDYMQLVRSNPNNVPGLPPFYPPMQTRVFVDVSGKTVEEADTEDDGRDWLTLPCDHTWNSVTYNTDGSLRTYRCAHGHVFKVKFTTKEVKCQ